MTLIFKLYHAQSNITNGKRKKVYFSLAQKKMHPIDKLPGKLIDRRQW